MLGLAVVVCAWASASAFVVPGCSARQELSLRAAVSASATEFLRQKAVFDLVYVERLAPPDTTTGGLFLVAPEDPPLHLARVISVGSGMEGECGTQTENAGVSAGDVVYCKHPWGIGPKDEQFGEEGEVRRFSFLRYQDIAAVVAKA